MKAIITDKIVSEKTLFLENELILNSLTKTKKLPNTCSTPKFYKSPTK